MFDIFFISWHTFWILWRYDILFDIVTYFLTSWRAFYNFWLHDVSFDMMIYFLLWGILYNFDVVMYLWVPWRYFLRHDIFLYIMMYFLYIMTLWYTFWLRDRCSFWRHDVLSIYLFTFIIWRIFYFIAYFLMLWICFDVTTYFLTLWRISMPINWCFAIHFDFVT